MHSDTWVLVNDRASRADIDLQPVIHRLAHAGCVPEVIPIAGIDRLEATLSEHQGRAPRGRIVVAGGDGSVNSCLAALLRLRRPLGVIPLGTANDFARTLGLPTDAVAAAGVIARGRTRRIDVGRVNECYFVNAAGIGLSNEVRDELDRGKKRVFGALAYAMAVARRWRHHQPFTVEIRGEHEQRRRVIQVTVANGRYYGGGLAAHHAATIDDGKLVLLMLDAKPLWKHVLHVMNLKTGVYDLAAPFFVGYASALRLSTRRRKRIATDGEIGTHTPAAFEVLPEALSVFVP